MNDTYYDKYYQIIVNRLENPLPSGEYGEYHHILPRSIYPEYKDDKSNLILLSVYDHIMAHFYLYKYYESVGRLKDMHKMKYACTLMIESQVNDINNELYTEKDMKELAEAIQVYKNDMKTYYERYPELRETESVRMDDYKRTILQYDMDGNFIKEWKGIKAAARGIGTYSQIIFTNLSGQSKSAKGFRWFYKTCDNYPLNIGKIVYQEQAHTDTKRVLQYDLNGNFIKEWKSLAEAGRELNIGQGKISSCAKGERKSCGNFIWRYKLSDDFDKTIQPYEIDHRYKKIRQYDRNGNFIKEWEGIKVAAETLGFKRQTLMNSLRGYRKTACGFIWKYA